MVGLLVALGQEYGREVLRRLLDAYVFFFRGTPLLVLLFLFYWSVLPALGLRLGTLQASTVVLALYSGAYQSQVFRSALRSVDEGQVLAGKALGMTDLQVLLHVIVPQALRISLPAWSNEYASLLKDSAICYALGVTEVLTRTRFVVIAVGEALLPYILSGVLFMLLTYGGGRLIEAVYKRLIPPGLLGGLGNE